MAINLMEIQPHKVSRDLSGYIIYVYGEGKTGKTTLASKIPGGLLIAFERGYNAIPGIMAQDVVSWGELKQVVRELKKPEIKERFKALIIDTVDICSSLCEKYVCSQNGVDQLNQIPYGQGWTLVKKEFEETFRSVTQLGYALVFISHAKDKVFKKKNGTEYNQTVPSCPSTYNEIAKNMADLYGFAEKYEDNGTAKVRLIIRSLDNSADTGSRFKYITPSIDFEYDELVKAINDAIDKEAQVTNNAALFTTERETITSEKTYNYEDLMSEFGGLVNTLMSENEVYNAPRITQIVDRYLGKGKKVSEATIDQVELIHLIIEEIKDELISK